MNGSLVPGPVVWVESKCASRHGADTLTPNSATLTAKREAVVEPGACVGSVNLRVGDRIETEPTSGAFGVSAMGPIEASL